MARDNVFTNNGTRHCTRQCCHANQTDRSQNTSSAPETNRGSRHIKLAIGLFAEQCQSGGVHWNSLPWTVLPEPFLAVEGPVLVTSAPEFIAANPELIFQQPPVPPPRSDCFFAA
jgi:hypothetical protein